MLKTLNILLVAVAAVAIFSLTSCDKEKVLSEDKTPEEITEYVDTHFPGLKIIQIVEDRDGFNKSYEVLLEGNIKLEFNRKKEIIEIESSEKLPDSVIPEKIRDYVTENFPDNYIIQWEIEDKHQQVELDNKLEIEFTMDGEFIRIDD